MEIDCYFSPLRVSTTALRACSSTYVRLSTYARQLPHALAHHTLASRALAGCHAGCPRHTMLARRLLAAAALARIASASTPCPLNALARPLDTQCVLARAVELNWATG